VRNFHEDFWTVAATLGPALAVTIVVVINRHDVLTRLRVIRGRARAAKNDQALALNQTELLIRQWSRWLQISAWAGFTLATAVTIIALLSLAATPPHDLGSPYITFGLLLGAGAMIPITSLVDSKFKSLVESPEPAAPPTPGDAPT
jgi:hypothetical protein